mmetsp:Transcript_6733/g.21573  ORF Transcript_6733/g.21573 Transcript_6733/m.21573 type:complete len:213 (+) Transcript_6733:579-1217(+)
MLGEVAHAEHVRDGDPAAGSEDAVHLAVDLRLVWREVDDAVGDQTVNDPVADRQVLDLPEPERHVRNGVLAGRVPRLGEHLGRHVHAYHVSVLPDLAGGDEAIHARTAAEIQDDLPRLQPGGRERVPTPQAQVRRLRDVALLVAQENPPLLRVSHVSGQHGRAAGDRLGVRSADGLADARLGGGLRSAGRAEDRRDLAVHGPCAALGADELR